MGQGHFVCVLFTWPKKCELLSKTTWKSKREANHLVVMVKPFEQLAPEIYEGLVAETEDIARFLGVRVWLAVITSI